MANVTQRVSLAQFVQLMNDELRERPCYQIGMNFVPGDGGYDFVAPTLTIAEEMALDKSVFDQVSINYTIVNK